MHDLMGTIRGVGESVEDDGVRVGTRMNLVLDGYIPGLYSLAGKRVRVVIEDEVIAPPTDLLPARYDAKDFMLEPVNAEPFFGYSPIRIALRTLHLGSPGGVFAIDDPNDEADKYVNKKMREYLAQMAEYVAPKPAQEENVLPPEIAEVVLARLKPETWRDRPSLI
jgi:hypothetical protein